jgi:threonine dehydrogenase-like Zn-dependent dehydrogenase
MSTFTGPGLVFAAERDCRVEEAVLDESALKPGEVGIEVEVSVVSAGTEVANFTGLDPLTRVPGSWNAYPHRPGYGGVGRVVALGPVSTPVPAAGGYAVGDRVFAICRHARYAVVDSSQRPIVPISPDDDANTIVLARMASVSITTLRKASHVDLGASAVVIGLGLVGNFAAQLLQVAGVKVVGLDRAPHRVDMAKAVGLTAFHVAGGDESRTVETALGGRADLVVEASGVPDASPVAVSLARDGGEVVLLGTPRGPFSGDATAMLVEVHRRGIRVIGALEWLLPLHSGPWQSRWSLYDDYLVLFDLFRRGKVSTAGLVTDMVAPARAQEMYSRLADREAGLGAVLFDWRNS